MILTKAKSGSLLISVVTELELVHCHLFFFPSAASAFCLYVLKKCTMSKQKMSYIINKRINVLKETDH